jgi:hypothetical protein
MRGTKGRGLRGVACGVAERRSRGGRISGTAGLRSSDGVDVQNKAKMRTFVNKKRKLVNQSNQQEYTRKRQNTGEDANGISSQIASG